MLESYIPGTVTITNATSGSGYGIDTLGNSCSGVVISGIRVSCSASSGIVVRGSNSVVQYCFTDHNTNGSGVTGLAGGADNCIYRFNLSEWNGTNTSQHHGFYIGGTNSQMYGNVSRYNACSGATMGYDTWGTFNLQVHDNLFYRNRFATTIAGLGNTNGTIYFYNNIFADCSNSIMYVANATIIHATNNIIWGSTLTSGDNSGTITSDYNLLPGADANWGQGAHTVTSSTSGFANTNLGNYFPLFNSAARGVALSTAFDNPNFFGFNRASVADIGMQYQSELAGTDKNFDTNVVMNRSYWVDPGHSITNFQGTFIGPVFSSSGQLNYNMLTNLPAHSVVVNSTGSTGPALTEVPGVTAGTYTKLTVDAQGLATVGASIAVGDLPNTGTAGTYRSTVFNAQGLETSGSNPTTFAGYAISDSSANLKAALTDYNGNFWTNLVYQYDTNAIPSTGVLTFGHAYSTNLQANVTMPTFTIGAAYFETIAIQLTNSTGTDTKMTMPAGVRGSWGSGTPAVFWCSNKLSATLYIQHYGTQETNAWISNWGP